MPDGANSNATQLFLKFSSAKMKLIKLPETLTIFEHAALEEWLVRNLNCEQDDYLLLYVNPECVVLGKNQCVINEVNIDFLIHSNEKVVRRVSGGGTVYHDKGNLNFAFVSKFSEHKVNNYALFNEPIRAALESLGVPAAFNHRNDMIANEKKISGNAQFTNRKNILSHGTILVNANLDNLRRALKKNTFEVQSKAVQSTRSSVENINAFTTSSINTSELMDLLASRLCNGELLISDEAFKAIRMLAKEKYESYEWRFLRSADFTVHFADVSMEVSDGIIAKEKAPQKLRGLKFYDIESLKMIQQMS